LTFDPVSCLSIEGHQLFPHQNGSSSTIEEGKHLINENP